MVIFVIFAVFINTLLERCGDLRREVIEPIIVGVPDDDFADHASDLSELR